MYFRLDFLVDRLKLNDASLVFDFSPHQPITIVLKAEDQTQDDTLTARGSLVMEQQVLAEVQAVFDAYAVPGQRSEAKEDEPLPNHRDVLESAKDHPPGGDQPPLAKQQEKSTASVTPVQQSEEASQSTLGHQALNHLPESFQLFVADALAGALA